MIQSLDCSSVPDTRTLVALNNMGVTLIQRRCYSEAIQTLKHALTLMGLRRSFAARQLAAPPLATTTTLDDRDKDGYCQNMYLLQASKSVARSTRPKTQASFPSHCELTVLSMQQQPGALLTAIHEFPSSTSAFALTIDCDELAADDSLTASKLLFNFAVVCRMSAQQTSLSGKYGQLLDRAYQCAQVANSLLMSELDVLGDEEAMAVALLVQQELIRLCMQRGDATGSQKYYGELCDLRSTMIDYEGDCLSHVPDQTAAAA